MTKAANISNFGGNSLDTLTAFSDRTLSTIQLDRVPHETDTHSYIERETDVINIKGFRCCLNFENTTADPLVIEMALIAVDTTDEGQTITITDEFFRNYLTKQRTETFTPAVQTGTELGCLKINNDKYKTLHRWKRTLNGTSATDERTKFWMFKRYFPFKRQFIYDSTEATDNQDSPHNGRLFLVHWAHKIIQAPSAATASSYNMQGSLQVFWRDVKSY